MEKIKEFFKTRKVYKFDTPNTFTFKEDFKASFPGKRCMKYDKERAPMENLHKHICQPFYFYTIYQFTWISDKDFYNLKVFKLIEPIFWIKHGIYPEWIKWLFCTILGGIIGGLITCLF